MSQADVEVLLANQVARVSNTLDIQTVEIAFVEVLACR